jgi:hypothetical protein
MGKVQKTVEHSFRISTRGVIKLYTKQTLDNVEMLPPSLTSQSKAAMREYGARVLEFWELRSSAKYYVKIEASNLSLLTI